jgi:ubiquinone/menaquinone biosynthesis C-methylase UbiE
MLGKFAHRSHKLERLDTGDYTPDEYAKWQSEMKLINRCLGDSRALRLELMDELSYCGDRVSILDVGAGSGELLKNAKEAIPDKRTFLVGAELNADAAKSISERSFGVSAVQCNALNLPFADDSFDFTVSSLFLHHLDDEQAKILIKEMGRVARKKFFVIDLHRHPAAYYLYRIVGRFFLQRFTIEDGSLSILRSFRPAELQQLAASAGISDAAIKRRAAFRLVLSGSKGSENGRK